MPRQLHTIGGFKVGRIRIRSPHTHTPRPSRRLHNLGIEAPITITTLNLRSTSLSVILFPLAHLILQLSIVVTSQYSIFHSFTMPRGKKNTNKPTIPELPWSENNHALTWHLLDEIAKTANYKVLYGKKTKDEVCVIAIMSWQISQVFFLRTWVVKQKSLYTVALPLFSSQNCTSRTWTPWEIVSRVNLNRMYSNGVQNMVTEKFPLQTHKGLS